MYVQGRQQYNIETTTFNIAMYIAFLKIRVTDNVWLTPYILAQLTLNQ